VPPGTARSLSRDRFVDLFDRFTANGAGNAPDWLKAVRERAMARFVEVGFPSTHDEAWRFTDVRPIADVAFRTPPLSGPPVEESQVGPFLTGAADAPVLVFVNGLFRPELSRVEDLPAGVVVDSLRRVLERDSEWLEANLARFATVSRNPFTALNTAFLHDGAIIHVPRGVVLRAPIRVLYLGVPSTDEAWVWHPRSLYLVQHGAQATIVEYHAGLGPGPYWSNAATEVVLGDEARLELYRVEREGEQAFHTAVTHSHQGRASAYRYLTASFGAALARQDLVAVLDGEGADCTLHGLSLLGGRQHADHHTTIEHAQPHCTSWEYFNGVFADKARGVFNGRILVRPGAQKTDAKQTNNNLLLSRNARADSQPQLEIYADDVRCTHGATLGPIDELHLFYLQSRGLTANQARRLLTYGFATDILQEVREPSVQRHLDDLVQARLTSALGVEGA
jgi:Fe-S cluster assembly protein SufD